MSLLRRSSKQTLDHAVVVPSLVWLWLACFRGSASQSPGCRFTRRRIDDLGRKFNKDRLVPLSTELLDRCHAYVKQIHMFSDPDDYFFPSPNRQPITIGSIYKNFRRFLWKARISHGGWGKGPRVHDFRHTFCVHCLKRWVLEGKNLSAYLPILKTYLGHHSFRDTSQYLRLTAELFPDITAKVEHVFGHVIPTIGGDGYETN